MINHLIVVYPCGRKRMFFVPDVDTFAINSTLSMFDFANPPPDDQISFSSNLKMFRIVEKLVDIDSTTIWIEHND